MENIERHLEYIGYYGSKVEAEVSVKRKIVKVNYNVTLGKRFPIKEIHYNLPSNDVFRNTFFSDTSGVMVKTQDFLSESVMEAETQRSAAFMRNKGYFTLSKNNYFFQADTLSIPGYAILDYTINEYTRNESPDNALPFRQFHFDNVVISHPENFRIKEKTLRGLNTIRPGDLYSETATNTTYSRLSSLSIING